MTQRGVAPVWWKPTGGPAERLIYGLATNPAAPGHVWAAHLNAGLQEWVPTTSTWHRVTPSILPDSDPLPSPSVARAVAVTDEQPPTVYLAALQSGVFRVRQGGKEWSYLAPIDVSGNEDEQATVDLASTEALALADTSGSSLFAATRGGVYVNRAGEPGWARLPYPGVDHDSSQTYSLLRGTDDYLYAGTAAGVWRVALPIDEPDDAGWEFIGPPSGTITTEIVTMVQLVDNTILVGTIGQGVWATTDGGATWSERNQGIDDDPRARRAQALLETPYGTFLGTTDYGIYHSRDGGLTWQPSGAGLVGPATSILALVFDPFTNILYAGTYGGGVYRSSDAGVSWHPMNEQLAINGPTISALAWAGPDRRTAYAGTQRNGLYRLDAADPSWARVSDALPLEAGGTAVRRVNDLVASAAGTWLTIASGTGVFLTTDGGVSWDESSSGLPVRQNVERLAQAEDPRRMVASVIPSESDAISETGLFQSVDGSTWQSLPSAIPCQPGAYAVCKTTALAMSAEGDTVYAGTLRGVAQSRDGGHSWIEPDPASPLDAQGLIYVQSTLQQRLLGLGPARSTLHAYSPQGSFSSTDGGQTWRFGLPAVNALAVDANRPAVVYASSNLTLTVPSQIESEVPEGSPGYIVWLSNDSGEHWQVAAFSEVPITALAADPHRSGHLIGGTVNAGVFEVSIPLPSPLSNIRVLIALFVFPGLPVLALFLVSSFMASTYRFLAKPYGLSLRHALRLRTRHGRALVEVNTPAPRLSALAQLILLTAPSHSFDGDIAWKRLTGVGAVTSQGDLLAALQDLVDSGLLVKVGETFQVAEPGLSLLAQANFGVHEASLIRRVRGGSQLFRRTEAFFAQAGFDVIPLQHQFVLVPRIGMVLGQGQLDAWLVLDRVLDVEDVRELAGQLRTQQRTLGFVVISMRPTAAAYANLRTLRQEENLRLALISTSTINQALRNHSAASSLDLAVRAASIDMNLYDLLGPVGDHVGLFGRQGLVDDLARRLNAGESLVLWSLPAMGKTSLLWNLREQLGPTTYGAVVNLAPVQPESAFYTRLLVDLSTEIQLAYTSQARPVPPLVMEGLTPNLPEDVSQESFVNHLRRLVEQLRAGGETPRFVLLIDESASLTDREVTILDTLFALAGNESYVSVICAASGIPAPVGSRSIASAKALALPPSDVWLSPLSEEGSRELLVSMGAQVGLTFTDAALHRLYLETGGQPLWLRAMGKRLANPEALGIITIDEDRVLAEVDAMMAGRFVLAEGLWHALGSEAQQLLIACAASAPAREPWMPESIEPSVHGSQLLEQMIALGLLDSGGDGLSPIHHIGLFARWLNVEFL